MKDVCVVIPAYKEEKKLRQVIIDVKAQGIDKIIVVDDCSDDATVEIAKDEGSILLKHERNMGVGASLRDGFKRADKLDCKYVVVVNADGQHDPNEIHKLIEPLRKNMADIVIGSRFKDGAKSMPLLRRIGNTFFSNIVSFVAGTKITDVTSGYRAYKKEILSQICITEERYGVEIEMALKARKLNANILEVPIKTIYGPHTTKMNVLLVWIQLFHPIIKYLLGG